MDFVRPWWEDSEPLKQPKLQVLLTFALSAHSRNFVGSNSSLSRTKTSVLGCSAPSPKNEDTLSGKRIGCDQGASTLFFLSRTEEEESQSKDENENVQVG